VTSWKLTSISDFLFEREGKFKPSDDTISGLKRLEKIDFSGNFYIANKPSNTNMITIHPGDLVISGINVSKGAMGIYDGDEVVTATIHYSSYTFDTDKVNVEYFRRFLKSAEFIRLLQEQVKGGIKTEIKPKHILPLKIHLPDLGEQEKIVSNFRSVESEDARLKEEVSYQQTLLKKLRKQILQEAIEGKLTANWREQNPDIESAEQLLIRIDSKRKEWLEEKKEDGYSEAKVIERKLKTMRNNYPNLPEDAVPSNWQWAPLLVVMNLIVDCHNKTAPYESTGVKLLRTTNIKNGKVILAGCKYVTEETYKYWSKRCVPLDGDILYTREAPVGEVAIIPEGEKLCMGQRMMLLRPFHELIDNQFILYALMAPGFLLRLEGAQKGAMVKHLRVGDVESAMIALPPTLEQKAIVAKVESLFATCDQLGTQIASNQSHAEQLMQAVLKEAFQQSSTELISEEEIA